MKARNLTPFEHVVFVLLDHTDRGWRAVGGENWPSIYEKALMRLVQGGMMEVKVPVRIVTRSTGRRLNATWRVTGVFVDELQQDIRHHMQTLGVEESDYVARVQPFTAARLTPEGEVAKLLLTEIFVPHKEPSEEDWWVMWKISGGPSGDRGEMASGEAVFLEGDDPIELAAAPHVGQISSASPNSPAPTAAPSPNLLMLPPESLGPLAEPLRSIENAIRERDASGAWPSVCTGHAPAQSPTPEGSRPDIVKKLDALLAASKYKHPVGRFGRWEPRKSAHNNRIVGRLLDELPDVSLRDAATILGAGSHTSIVRTEAWKERRGGDGADALSYAEHHQNMHYDEDASAEDPAKVVASREEDAAQLREAAIRARLTSKFRDIQDDDKVLEDAAALSVKDAAAYSRLAQAWEVVQCTAPHQPEES